MFPWLIWLCMAGTAKGTVPSPLPSGAYIRLTGTSHFHRYYGAIRLPTTLLRPSFRCVHIPRFTRFHGRCRLSPVGKDSIVQHGQVLDTAAASITVQNYDEFLETYGVKEGDGMYLAPEDRIRVW